MHALRMETKKGNGTGCGNGRDEAGRVILRANVPTKTPVSAQYTIAVKCCNRAARR